MFSSFNAVQGLKLRRLHIVKSSPLRRHVLATLRTQTATVGQRYDVCARLLDVKALTRDHLLRDLNLRLRGNETKLLELSGTGMRSMGGDLVIGERERGAERTSRLDVVLHQTTKTQMFADNARSHSDLGW